MNDAGLKVRSHVARDLLQSADLFRHPERVVWEYVANGLEYVVPGISPHVQVSLRFPENIAIRDNGRGMDFEGLSNFFTMHAENRDRASGRPGRGMFGTGKSAAFAIANLMRITTVKSGKRSIVELHRSDLEAASSGDPVPVRELEREVATSEPDGTKVEIAQFRIKKLNRGDVIKAAERHLRHWGRGVRVDVDGATVEPHIPPIENSREYVVTADESMLLAGSTLHLHVAKAPLAEEDRGVAVLCNGTLHETTLGTAKGKPMAQYIFGEIDVPGLATPYEGIAAFDMSRSGQLNPENAIVMDVNRVVSRQVEALRSELVEREKQRKREEEAVKLREQADQIAQLINEDFSEYSKRLNAARTKGGQGSDLRETVQPSESGDTQFLHGGDEPARVLPGDVLERSDGPWINPTPHPAEPKVEPASPEESDSSGRHEPRKPAKRHPSGGFNVEFRPNGEEASRAFYERDSRTIFINLDHPQVKAARGMGEEEDANFKRLSFEIAFTEYAIGFAQEKAGNNEYLEFYEPLFDMRERIDNLARRAATFFAASGLATPPPSATPR